MSNVAMFFIGFASGIFAFIVASVIFAIIAKKRHEKKLADLQAKLEAWNKVTEEGADNE